MPDDVTPTVPGTDPNASPDPDALGALIDTKVNEKVTALLAARSAPPSPAPGGGAPSPAGSGTLDAGLLAAIDARLARAFNERDNEDALVTLEREIAELKLAAGASAARKPALWTRLMVGMP